MSKNKAFSIIEVSIVILIVGILIFGVNKGLDLFNKSKLSSAQTITRNSPVRAFDDVVLWLETTMPESIINQYNSKDIEDQDYVQTWVNLQTQFYLNNATQSLSNSNRPKYVKNGINNLPVLRFDGNDYFKIPKVVTDDWTIIVVYTYRSGGSGAAWYQGAALIGADSPGQANDFGFTVYTTGLNAGVGNTSNSIYIKDSNASKVGQSYIGIYSRDSKNGKIYLYVNGKLSDNTTNVIASGTKNSPSISNYFIGSDPALISSYFLTGDIAEIIIFSSVLTQEDRNIIESYLSKKWGIKLN